MTYPHADFIPVQNILKVKGKEPVVFEIEGKDEGLEVKIPGGVKYHNTFRFKVKNRKLENLRFKQVVKKGGLTIRTTEVDLGTREPSESEIYEVDTPEDETPGGWLTRGVYQASTTYYEGDQELFTARWTLELTK
ncbi:hypothetical protein KGF57_001215 [Candida theae]|uniref:Rho GDP-dissociation inhibitor n=1 Tax=Candida theae TaxID=1198502 RepID=A0AAD5G041_9ASCO|nr:uncharacterized protein KGF57_001215 [Candida theae]KAI5963840.1 hypothetical protein KGF57_001215 [Candida theae]